jgi:hypothetical protein
MPLGYPEDVIERALERIEEAAAEYALPDLLQGNR